MLTYQFLYFLTIVFFLGLIAHRYEKAFKGFGDRIGYEYWFLVSGKGAKFEALRDARASAHYFLLQSCKKRKPFGQKALLKKLLGIGAGTSELTAFHFALFELLADYDSLTPNQCMMVLGHYDHLPQTEKDILMDILSWYRTPVLAKLQ